MRNEALLRSAAAGLRCVSTALLSGESLVCVVRIVRVASTAHPACFYFRSARLLLHISVAALVILLLRTERKVTPIYQRTASAALGAAKSRLK